jgi:glutathione synthase/RimK-type ligase-like ATP-grasp enzyme
MSVSLSLFAGALSFYIFSKKYDRGYIYHYPCMVEPYFNDDEDGFASLRCTVIGNEVVEAVKRINRRNITSNISSGGTAEKIELSAEQTKMAIKAMHAVGAEYAGVDFLVCGNKSVIGEVNIGPFTLFGDYTGVNVGKIF